jgi:hypothetical protein
MQVETREGLHRALTIEVDPAKRAICQVRGKLNRPPNQLERTVIEQWAAREGLTVADTTLP